MPEGLEQQLPNKPERHLKLVHSNDKPKESPIDRPQLSLVVKNDHPIVKSELSDRIRVLRNRIELYARDPKSYLPHDRDSAQKSLELDKAEILAQAAAEGTDMSGALDEIDQRWKEAIYKNDTPLLKRIVDKFRRKR